MNLETEKSERALSADATAEGRYEKLSTEREPYLLRGRESAKLTIPSLLPEEGSNGHTRFVQPWQSVGAKGVNNLANRIVLVLFPPGGSFFRVGVDPITMDKILGDATEGGEEAQAVRAEFEEALGKVERTVMDRIEERGVRMQKFEAARQLIVSGNALLQVLPDESLKMHRLDRYVVKRDLSGTVVEMIVKETVDRTTLSEDLQDFIRSNPASSKSTDNPDEQDVTIYTWIQRVGKKWVTHQEIFGQTVPKSEGTYPLDKTPWIPLRFISVDGEDYGRGFVEEIIGDLASYDSLRQSVVEGSAIAARMIPLVDEAGVTQIKDLTEARNGQPIHGNAKDVTFLQTEKQADLRVAADVAAEVKRDLFQAFLLLAGAQRDAERVTAEEIRLMAQELETAFGGTYSVQTQDWQKPFAQRVIYQMQRRKELPSLPEKTVNLKIVTGLAGLGRNSDLGKMDLWIGGANELFGPEAVAEYVPVGAYLTSRATMIGLDVTGILRPEDVVQEKRQQAQKMAMAEKSIGPVAQLAGKTMQTAGEAPPQQ